MELQRNPIKDAVKAEKESHRKKLTKTSNRALELIDDRLEDATIDQQAKVYDITRKHLNTMDGINSTTQTNQFFVIPAEMVINNYESEKYKKQVEKLRSNISKQQTTQSNSTHAKQKSPKTATDSESSIVEGVLVKPSSQDKN